jgi:phosphatidylglycerol:prolipoprotein diacylglycerol transferase
MYLFLYGLFRFLIEYFREPDADLGYRIEFIKNNLSPAMSHPPLSFSTGQILSFGMMVIAVVWVIIASRLPDREAVRVYSGSGNKVQVETGADDKTAQDAERNRRRKLRKELQRKKLK